jgi:flagellar biosynthesis/type III secretory pathway M-ring protein FliF/YscJ
LDYKDIYNNKQNQNLIIMGCGCKNNGNQTPPQPPPSGQNPPQGAPRNQQQQNESIKSSIKKTVEKYYNVNKTNTNGWVKG